MKTICNACLFILYLVLTFRVSTAAPMVLGLSNNHALNEIESGQLLIQELRCTACHAAKTEPALERVAPLLTDVGSRASVEYLQRFIADPAKVHVGTTMPGLLATQSVEQRDLIAKAITHFLLAQSTAQPNPEPISQSDSAAGKELFHTVGCVACHAPRDELLPVNTPAGNTPPAEDDDVTVTRQPTGAVELNHVPTKYSQQSLQQFLFQPLKVRPSGRMPDMKLTTVESQALASYLMGAATTKTGGLTIDENLVAAGKKYYQQFNCVACHKLENVPAAVISNPLHELNAARGCLDPKDQKTPRFQLDATQTKLIQQALAASVAPSTDLARINHTLTAMNCIACHLRDQHGGVAVERNPYFQTTEKNLGEDARIPPPLTLVGAKLQPNWLKKVLFDGESVRHYMVTRMPQYGNANLQHLPEILAREDTVEPVKLALPEPESHNKQVREREKELRAAGRELLGTKGLSCVNCHNFNGKLSPGHKGIDLMTTTQRLQPSWYYHFMRSPGGYRPRIVMPDSWPGGVAVHKTILNGNTDEQIAAIWYYLTLGRSAQDPPGIQPVDTKLAVTETTRVYRGRSSVAGYRGIAVGFPGGLSYAFNAETGTLTALWQGDFIRVDRNGQGSGSFNPLSRAIQLAQDVSFTELPDEQTPWPLRPVMNKAAPVNPNPLYPKNLGYQFQGYFMDEKSVPTFMYRTGELAIEDRSTLQIAKNQKLQLERVIQFTAPKQQTIWFRALTGKIESESKQQFKSPELRISIPAVQTILRPLTTDPKDPNLQELLLRLDISPGKSNLTIKYEPLP